MRDLDEIIVHCSATRPNWWADKTVLQKVAEFRRWHTEKGWADIGYHYVIDRDGAVATGRDVSRIGAHVKGRNKRSIGVCLVGGHGSSENDSFADNFTPEQSSALRKLIDDLRQRHGQLNVSGHNQWAAKACPGFYVPTWLEGGAMRRIAHVPEEVSKVVEDANKAPSGSTTIWTIISTYGAGAYAFWQAADDGTRIAMGVIGLFLAYLLRERIRKANLGQAAARALGF